MIRAIVSGILVFALTFIILMLIEKYIHKITHNPYKNYKWGVWLLSILLGSYAFLANIGTS